MNVFFNVFRGFASGSDLLNNDIKLGNSCALGWSAGGYLFHQTVRYNKYLELSNTVSHLVIKYAIWVMCLFTCHIL